jgi:hypothetical protein
MAGDEMSTGTPSQLPDVAQALAPAAVSAVGPAAGAMPPAGQVGWRASDVLGRIVAMLLLPLSIAPVLLLGPSVLRAPVTLAHEGWGDVQRLERRLHPELPYRTPPVPAPGPSVWQTRVSLGPIYGRWSELPGAGREGITWRGAQ